ncbi:hypothetical protein KY285_036425 [Solanum tuberosum]|nr:hypothetical protein KY285_036425 [Solanum tuberosum]
MRPSSCRNFQPVDRPWLDKQNGRDQGHTRLQNKEVVGASSSIHAVEYVLRLSEYGFNISPIQLFASMRNIKEARFSEPMTKDLGTQTWDANSMEHTDIKRGIIGISKRRCPLEMAILLRNDYLREFLSNRAKVAGSGFHPLSRIPHCCPPWESGPCLSPSLCISSPHRRWFSHARCHEMSTTGRRMNETHNQVSLTHLDI